MIKISYYFLKRLIWAFFFPLAFVYFILKNDKTNMMKYLSKIKSDNNISFHRTLWVNFVCFPMKTAIKCPIWVWGKIDFINTGEIKIVDDVYSGMVKINCLRRRTMSKTKIENEGTITIREKLRLFGGAHIIVTDGATLELGKGVTICEDTLIWCSERIEIGAWTDLAYRSQVFDCNGHYTIDLTSKHVSPYTKPVKIGKYVWIGNSNSILPGSMLNDFTIVSSPYSALRKDVKNTTPHSVLSGNPAMCVKKNIARLYDIEVERNLFIHRFDKEPYSIVITDENISKLIEPDECL